MELKPDEFWALTYAELVLLSEGYKERSKVRRNRDGFLLANLLQPHSPKRRLKVEMFTGEGGGSGNQGWHAITAEEYQALMARKRQGE